MRISHSPQMPIGVSLNNTSAREDFQNGGRYVELDLLSKLTADEYFGAFREAGLCATV
jgi:hypothetical protein